MWKVVTIRDEEVGDGSEALSGVEEGLTPPGLVTLLEELMPLDGVMDPGEEELPDVEDDPP